MIPTISLVLSITTAIVAIVALISVLKYRVDRSEVEDGKLADKVDKIITDLSKLLADLKVLTAEQAIINKFTTQTLSSLDHKLEEHARILNDHAACFKILNELLKKGTKGINVE